MNDRGSAPSVASETVEAATEDAGAQQPPRRLPLPPTAVVIAWLVGRVVVLAAGVYSAASSGAAFGFITFSVMDGGWYRNIAESGFSFTLGGTQTGYAFFPALPALLAVGGFLGVSSAWTGVVLTNLVFLIALWGVHVLARRHGGSRVATIAVWGLALFPFTVTSSMIYPDAYVLAAAVWAFVAVEDRHDVAAAALCVAAAMFRPNGIAVAVGVAAGLVLLGRQWRRAAVMLCPAVAAVALWCTTLWIWTGNPLQFLSAKEGWKELDLVTVLARRGDRQADVETALALLAVVLLVWQWRRLQAGWLVYAAVYLLPSFLLGVIGFGRYVAATFPVAVAAGFALEKTPRAVRIPLAALSAVLLGVVATRILHWPDYLWIP